MGNESHITKSGTVALAHQRGRFAFATYSLIILNVLLFLVALPGDISDLAWRFGLIPNQLDPITLLSTLFLHYNFTHLFINMSFLWLFGRKVERTLGPVFFLFYIGSGLVASLLHVAITTVFFNQSLHTLADIPILGASGAVAGVLGMYAVRYPHDKVEFRRFEIPAFPILMVWLVSQFVLGIAQIARPSLGIFDLRHVGYWSHIGGFIFGVAAALVALLHEKSVRLKSHQKNRANQKRRVLLDMARKFESLITSDPSDPFGYAELGRTCALLSEKKPSVANYLKAAELYRKGGKQKEALAAIRDALDFWPETMLTPDVVFRFATFFEVLGEYKEAENRYEWLSNAASGTMEAEMSLLRLGQLLFDKRNDANGSAEVLERLVRDYPKSKFSEVAENLLVLARKNTQ